MKQIVTIVTVVLAFTLNTAQAEPYEDNPAASASDPDYAAGKAANEKKNWGEAVTRK